LSSLALPMLLKFNSKSDRRRRQRQLLNTSVQIFTGSGRIDALGINISEVGMGLFTLANLPLGSQIQVEFLPPGCKERVRTSGLVRYRALYLYGIEFMKDADQDSHGWADADEISSPAHS
jgi:hypothetical protein